MENFNLIDGSVILGSGTDAFNNKKSWDTISGNEGTLYEINKLNSFYPIEKNEVYLSISENHTMPFLSDTGMTTMHDYLKCKELTSLTSSIVYAKNISDYCIPLTHNLGLHNVTQDALIPTTDYSHFMANTSVTSLVNHCNAVLVDNGLTIANKNIFRGDNHFPSSLKIEDNVTHYNKIVIHNDACLPSFKSKHSVMHVLHLKKDQFNFVSKCFSEDIDRRLKAAC